MVDETLYILQQKGSGWNFKFRYAHFQSKRYTSYSCMERAIVGKHVLAYRERLNQFKIVLPWAMGNDKFHPILKEFQNLGPLIDFRIRIDMMTSFSYLTKEDAQQRMESFSKGHMTLYDVQEILEYHNERSLSH